LSKANVETVRLKSYFSEVRELKYIALIYLLLTSLFSHAQPPTLPLITNFSPKEYNAHAQNFGVVQDARGVLYFANVSGILQFDGANWTKYPTTLNGLSLSIGIDNNGTVYAGGIGEFGKLAIDSVGQYQFESLSADLPDSLQDFNNVWNVDVLGDKVYFNTMKYIFVLQNGQLSHVSAKNTILRSFTVNGEIWYQDKDVGLFRLDGLDPDFLPRSEFFAEMSVSGIIPYKDHQFLVATRDSGLYFYSPHLADTSVIIPFDNALNAELKQAKPYGTTRLETNQIAINTLQDGVFILSEDLELNVHLSRAEGLQNETVIGLFEDRNGHLWLGTDNGISFVALNNALSYAQEGDRYNGAMQAITTHQGDLYLSTIQGVYRFADVAAPTTNAGFERVQGIPGQCFDFLSIDGDLLVASPNIYTVNGLSSEPLLEFQSRVFCEVKQDPITPTVLVGGADGLVLIQKENGRWNEWFRIEDLPDEVQDITQEYKVFNAGQDSLYFWISTWSKGTLLLSFDKSLEGYNLRSMADSAQAMPHGQVTHFQLNNTTYFATAGGTHVYDADSNKFVRDYLFFPDGNEFIFKVQEDEKGEIWASNGSQIYHFIEQNGRYNIDTVPFMSVDIGAITALYKDLDGNLWVGGDNALINYRQELAKNNSFEEYNCLIRRVIQGADSLMFGGEFSENGLPVSTQTALGRPMLVYGQNSLSFEFSTTYYEHRDKIKFAHQLVGYEEDFSAWTSESKAVYTNLPEGDYTFRVKATNVYTVESNVAEYSFTVLPPWYRTWWAYALYVFAAATVFLIGIKINARRLTREKANLEEQVLQRTLELDEKNQALQEINEEILLQKALVEEKNRDITDSILYAEKMQQAILTGDDYLKSILPEHFLFYQPKSILSGDFYWAYGLKNEAGETDRVIYATVDCTGHGVPGALMSMIGSALLNEIVIEMRQTEVDKVLNELRSQIIKAFSQTGAVGESQDGMDMAICMWDKTRNVMEFAGAKNQLYHVRNGTLTEYKGDSQPIGYYPELRPFKKQIIDLEEGDTVYTFSDGFVDQFGGQNEKKFLSANFRKLLISVADLGVKEQKVKIVEAFNAWKGDIEQVDDVCVIGVRI
jgi:serine phosphatase RsbU (regulator of sigma subunit)